MKNAEIVSMSRHLYRKGHTLRRLYAENGELAKRTKNKFPDSMTVTDLEFFLQCTDKIACIQSCDNESNHTVTVLGANGDLFEFRALSIAEIMDMRDCAVQLKCALFKLKNGRCKH